MARKTCMHSFNPKRRLYHVVPIFFKWKLVEKAINVLETIDENREYKIENWSPIKSSPNNIAWPSKPTQFQPAQLRVFSLIPIITIPRTRGLPSCRFTRFFQATSLKRDEKSREQKANYKELFLLSPVWYSQLWSCDPSALVRADRLGRRKLTNHVAALAGNDSLYKPIIRRCSSSSVHWAGAPCLIPNTMKPVLDKEESKIPVYLVASSFYLGFPQFPKRRDPQRLCYVGTWWDLWGRKCCAGFDGGFFSGSTRWY